MTASFSHHVVPAALPCCLLHLSLVVPADKPTQWPASRSDCLAAVVSKHLMGQKEAILQSAPWRLISPVWWVEEGWLEW